MTSVTASRPTPNDVAKRPVPLRRALTRITPDEPAPLPNSTCIMQVTPALAAGWLLRNTKNRSVRTTAVSSMVRDMLADRWKFTGGSIGFDTNGALVDGQHRLLAIVQSDTTQRFVIVPDLDPEAMSVVDTGAKRTAADAVSFMDGMDGVSVSLAAAVARLGVSADAGTLASKAEASTNSEIMAWLEANPDVREYVRRANSLRRHYDVPPAVIGYCMWRLSKVDVFEAGRFFDDWRELRTTGNGDPVASLIQRFRSAKAGNERITRAAQIGAIFRVWNARRAGTPLSRVLTTSRQGRIDIPEPK